MLALPGFFLESAVVEVPDRLIREQAIFLEQNEVRGFAYFSPLTVRRVPEFKEKRLREVNRHIDIPLAMDKQHGHTNLGRLVVFSSRTPVVTDILDRAIPWTRLIYSTSRLPTDLNLDWKSRLSALSVWGLLMLSTLGLSFPLAWIGVPVLAGFLIGANFPLYRFFFQRGGLWFASGAVLLHFLYFFYSSLTFGLVSIQHLVSKKNQKASISHT